MDIQASKLELVKLIVNLDNQKLIEKILSTLKDGQDDFWLDLTAQEKDEIKLGIRLLDEGKRTSLDDFLKKIS